MHTVACHCATLPSTMYPRVSSTLNYCNSRTLCEALAVALRTASSEPVVEDPVYLAPNRVNLQLTMERWPNVGFHAIREHGQRMTHG